MAIDRVRVDGPVQILGPIQTTVGNSVAIDGTNSTALPDTGTVELDQTSKGPVPVTIDDPAVTIADPVSFQGARVTDFGEAHSTQKVMLLADTWQGSTLDGGVSLGDLTRWVSQGTGDLTVGGGCVSLATSSETGSTQKAIDSQQKFQPIPGTMIVLEAMIQLPGTPYVDNRRIIGFRDDAETTYFGFYIVGSTIRCVVEDANNGPEYGDFTAPTGVGTTNYFAVRIEWAQERIRFLARGAASDPYTVLWTFENFFGRAAPFMAGRALRCYVRSWDIGSASALAINVGTLAVSLVGDIGQAAWRAIAPTGVAIKSEVLVRGPGFLHGIRIYDDENDEWVLRDSTNDADNTAGKLMVRKVAHAAAPTATAEEEFIPVNMYFAEGLTLHQNGADDGLLLMVRG